MNLNIDLRIVNGEIVVQSLEDLMDEIPKVGRLRLYRMLLSAKKSLSNPARPFSGIWAAKTPLQHRYIMWAVKKTSFELSMSKHRNFTFSLRAVTRGYINIPYQRTGRFAKGVKIKRTDSGYSLTVGGAYLPGTGMSTGVPYALELVGDIEGEGQSWVHQGRWRTFRSVVEGLEERVPEELMDDIAITVRKGGFEWE